MKKTTISFVCFLLSFLLVFQLVDFNPTVERKVPKELPNDWFLAQRVFPQQELNYDLFKKAVKQSQALSLRKSNDSRKWQLAGPTNIGGRISDIELHPSSFDIIYVGAASGGVFKSIDRGENWTPIFDDAVSLSIGDIAIDPNDSQTIYVGTGEANAGGGSMTYGGFGIYKSTNAGESWENIGLEKTRYISRIVIDPSNTDKIFVGAMGKLFNKNNERGIYRSTDGGKNWENVLFISDSTGCIDLAINPQSPNIVYAAMWERRRSPYLRNYGGITCGIYRSKDGGNNWTQLTNGLPNDFEKTGRIGLAISNSNPNVIYSIYVDNYGYFKGVYKSENGGDLWFDVTGNLPANIFSSFGWWFGNIRVDPNDPNIIFALGLRLYKSVVGGNTWTEVTNGVHVDQHGMYIHPQNSNVIYLGNDGGAYISNNGAETWKKWFNLPITQFYTCEVDYLDPDNLYGGTQDNSVIRTITGSTDDWNIISLGDGFYVLVDPTDNNYVYLESQFGYIERSIDGGQSFRDARNGISGRDRRNWNVPIVFDPTDPSILYTGTHRVYKSVDRAESWFTISDDLSKGNNHYTQGMPYYGFATLTTIAVSKSSPQTIYAGTDDGNVAVTFDGGGNWQIISDQLPVRWITRVAVDPDNNLEAYVTLSGYRDDVYLPHVFKTIDGGQNWEDISGNLPEAPVNDIIVDTHEGKRLFVATDVGVYQKEELETDWFKLGDDLPNVPVTDIDLHNPTRMLLAATYGRSLHKISLNEITDVNEIAELPEGFKLTQNYPNPFNPTTTIEFNVPKNQNVKLTVYNALGQKVNTIFDEFKAAGNHAVTFDAGNLNSGVYFYKLQSEDFVESKKMILLK